MKFVFPLIILIFTAQVASAQTCRRFGHAVQVCNPITHQPLAHVPAVQDDVIVVQQNQTPIAPIIVQNNYPPVGIGVGSTTYGYSQPYSAPQPYLSSPQYFAPDPRALLSEAARLTERSQDLAGKALETYERLGAVALLSSSSTTSAPQQLQMPQAYSAPGRRQSICITPDGQGGFNIKVVDEPLEEPAPPVSPAGNDPTPSSTLAPSSELEQRFVSILSSRCAKCHTAPDAKGEFTLVDADGRLASLSDEQVTTMLEAVRLGQMPSEGEPLSDDDLAVLRTYLR